MDGYGITKDTHAGVRWYRRAAQRGDAWAQLRLAAMYAKGEHVPKTTVKHSTGTEEQRPTATSGPTRIGRTEKSQTDTATERAWQRTSVKPRGSGKSWQIRADADNVTMLGVEIASMTTAKGRKRHEREMARSLKRRGRGMER